MINRLLLFVFVLSAVTLSAQTPNQMLYKAHRQFSSVKTFKSNVHIKFNLPSISIEDMSGKAYYKAPSKFRVRMKGIAFLPKDNPFNVYDVIRDSSQYATVLNGKEKIGNETCNVVSVIPNGNSDLVFAKIWLGSKSNCMHKMELTSRTNGVVTLENIYGAYKSKSLPDRMRFTVDMNKFKVPKALSADINSRKTTKGNSGDKSKGVIEFVFSNYALNTKVEDSVFKEGK